MLHPLRMILAVAKFFRDPRQINEEQSSQLIVLGYFQPRYLSWLFLCLAVTLGQFLLRFRHGVGSFTPDDIMNLWIHSIRVSWSQELLNCLTFSEPLDRSGAAFFYRLLFETFHLEFAPFAMAHTVLLVLNSIVVFEVIRLLSSDKSALVATLLFSRVPMLMDIYYPLSTVYDVMSSVLAWTSVLLWLNCMTQSQRAQDCFRLKSIWGLLLAAVFYQISIATKELAIFPFLFAACLGLAWSPKIALCVFSLPFFQTIWYLTRKLNPANGMAQNPGYHWSGTPSLLWENTVWYVRWSTDFVINEPTPTMVLLAVLLILAVVIYQRSIMSLLSLAFLVVAFVFVLGLFRRNLYVFYVLIPLVPISILRGFRAFHRVSWGSLFSCMVVLASLEGWWCEYRWDRYGQIIAQTMQPAAIAVQSLRDRPFSPKRGAVVLVTNDPFSARDYTVQMLLSLYSSDVNLSALRVKFGENKDPASGLDKVHDATVDLGKRPD